MEKNDHKDKNTKTPISTYKAPNPLRFIIAGGGTGGHLFPGIAIAQELMARNSKNRVIFIGTGKPIEVDMLSKTGFEHKSITVKGIKGLGLWKKAVSISKIPKGIFESIMILRSYRPDLVIGVGGYAAGPLAIGAWLLGIKIVLHEQNILPGMTNRILSRLADRIYVSFNDTPAGLNPEKIRFAGNPVRKEILQCSRNQKVDQNVDPVSGRRFNVLIIGGSQGAHSINMAILDAIEHINEKNGFFFVHQTGFQDEAILKNAYMLHDIPSKVQPFFADMAREYQNADLVICRAGATTVAEVTAVGKGVIFIPFPFAADNHQVLNAQSLEKNGAAEMILEKDLSGKVLAERINYYASNPDDLQQMASRAKSYGRPDAAAFIVDDFYKLINPE
jgi:UDP-N-acetylglucosamine--N-acetylmuramyl-(pentapeptide) pyrophosphoryl-undecaprenol N-acetylglucosamine transferase